MRTLHRWTVWLALALPGIAVHAQNVVTDTSAQVLAYWSVGDVRTYDVERVKTGRRPGRTTFRMALRVIDATDSTYVLEARYTAVEATADLPDDPRSKALLDRLLKASEGLRVVCVTDDTGVPIALSNEAEVAEHARTVMATVLAFAQDEEERKRMEQSFSGVLSANVLAQAALEDIGNLLFAFGVEYRLGFTEHVATAVPDPLGGEPLPVRQTFTLMEVDPFKRSAAMLMEQVIDAATLEDELDERLQAMGGDRMTRTEQEDLRTNLRGLSVTDRMEIEMDLNGAWTTRAVLMRTTEVFGMRETDKRSYLLRR